MIDCFEIVIFRLHSFVTFCSVCSGKVESNVVNDGAPFCCNSFFVFDLNQCFLDELCALGVS